MRSRRILIVSAFELTATGGVTSAVRALRDELTALGHEVSILIPADENRVTRLATEDGSRLFGFYMRLPFIEQQRVRSFAGFLLHAPRTLLSLRRFIEQNGIDIVAIHYPLPWMFYLGIVRRLTGCRLVVTYQGNDAHDLMAQTRADRRLIAGLLRRADAIVAVSRSLADAVSAAMPGLRRERIRIIPNGAAECRSRAPVAGLPAQYIATVGHLIHRKGMDTLIDALSAAAHRGCTSSLVIVGDGPDRPALEERVRAAGLEARVFFAGTRSQEETSAIVQRSRFFVLASRAEGLPLVVVEAMSCRKAIVATNVDGVPEVVLPGVTGLLVPPDDPAALADTILELDSDDALRSRLAAGAFEHFRRGFTWRSIAQRYSELFESVTSGGSVGSGRARN
jgi:glycosyltransferase involved in cell wall biosynthesis